MGPVYVLFQHTTRDKVILGIYSSEVDAQRELLIKQDRHDGSAYYVEPHLVQNSMRDPFGGY